MLTVVLTDNPSQLQLDALRTDWSIDVTGITLRETEVLEIGTSYASRYIGCLYVYHDETGGDDNLYSSRRKAMDAVVEYFLDNTEDGVLRVSENEFKQVMYEQFQKYQVPGTRENIAKMGVLLRGYLQYIDLAIPFMSRGQTHKGSGYILSIF